MNQMLLENKSPKNWLFIPLIDVIYPIKGKKPKILNSKQHGTSLPYIDIKAFEKQQFRQFTSDPMCPRCFEDDVLIVWDGARSGLSGTRVSGIIGSTLCKLECFEISKKYLYYFLQMNYDEINKNTKGIGIPHVNPSFLFNLNFPLSTLNEQKRIVEKIEELFSKLDHIKTTLEKIKLQTELFKKMFINKMVTKNVFENNNKYRQIPLTKIITSLSQGWSPRCENTSSSNEDEWAVITTTAIQTMKFVDSKNKKLPHHLKSRPKLELKKNDLLITRAGPRTRVGIACLIKNTRKRLILCDKAYRIRFNHNLITPSFFEIVLNSPEIIKELDVIKTGIDDSGLNLTMKKFCDLSIPLPTLEQQKEIVSKIEQGFSYVENIQKTITSTKSQLETLRKSVLKNAFEGRLVSQDQTDEPAEILLQRIKEEKRKYEEKQKLEKQKRKLRRKKNVK